MLSQSLLVKSILVFSLILLLFAATNCTSIQYDTQRDNVITCTNRSLPNTHSPKHIILNETLKHFLTSKSCFITILLLFLCLYKFYELKAWFFVHINTKDYSLKYLYWLLWHHTSLAVHRHLIGKSRSLADPTIFLNYHMSTVCFFDEKRALHQRHEFSVGKLNYQERSTRMFTSLSAKDWVICECNIKRKESDASPSRHVTRKLIWRPPTLQVSME